MKPEETIDFHIKRTWQSIAKMYNEEAGKYGATMAIGFVLLNVDPKEGTPSTSLGPKMGIEATSLSRVLKNMQEQGLIERRPNPKDGRGVLIFLTDFGKEKRADAKRAVVRFNEVVFSELPKQKVKHFFEVTETINELISSKKVYTQAYEPND